MTNLIKNQLGTKLRVSIIESPTMELSEQLFEIQKAIWGISDKDALPAWKIFTTPKSSGLLIVAYKDNKPIAYAIFTHALASPNMKPYLYMDMLGVLSEHQGKKIGERIVKEAITYAKNNGYTAISWSYDPFQYPSANLYIRKLGAVITKFSPNLYGRLSGTDHGPRSDRFLAELHFEQTPKISYESKITHSYSLFDSTYKLPAINKSMQAIQIEVPKMGSNDKKGCTNNTPKLTDSCCQIFKHFLNDAFCITDFVQIKGKNYYIARRLSD